MTARRVAPGVALLLLALTALAQSRERTTTDADAPAPPVWLVDLNNAPAPEIALLPRLGPTLSQRVATQRDTGGPYTSLEDMARRVRGVGPRTIQRIEPFVRMGN